MGSELQMLLQRNDLEKFVNLEIGPPKGVLCYGPLHQKTLLARVANRAYACFIRVIGSHLEHTGSDLAQTRSNKGSPHMPNGYSHELQESLSDPLPGSVVDPHQQLLLVLSNIGTTALDSPGF
ncbi:26S proteasome regulatory subunit 7 [Camellia lanceoleosa]|uniref:26S proteasome regulatory subunit 7 n=1 Tax=Camellia lanceoleosa TaxID=1840588 RepID=A0ACC0G4Z6_9ERIC|nr:26S proteasome regulatory subunit 7 [Camellia lanceoleosa]